MKEENEFERLVREEGLVSDILPNKIEECDEYFEYPPDHGIDWSKLSEKEFIELKKAMDAYYEDNDKCSCCGNKYENCDCI